MPALSKTGVKQGCPLSPTLFGLFADGLHRFLLHCGPCLANGKAVPDLGYADDFVLLATTAQGLQRLLDAVAKFCISMGMVISIQKTKVIAFGHLYPVPYQWTVNGEQLEVVLQIKYLGVVFTAHTGLSLTFGPLEKNMCAAWALLNASMGVCNAYLLWASSSGCTWCVFQVQRHMAARFGDWHACQPLPLLLGSNCVRLIYTC